MVIFTNFYSIIDLKKINRQEIKQKHRIANDDPINIESLIRKIPVILTVFFILSIPFCIFDLLYILSSLNQIIFLLHVLNYNLVY